MTRPNGAQHVCADRRLRRLGKLRFPRPIVSFGDWRSFASRLHRFPHRNKILGRQYTAAEQEFLTQPGSNF